MAMRTVKILFCVLLIASVATILITPDQNDDVPGVLHHLAKVQQVTAVWAAIVIPPAPLPLQAFTPVVLARASDPPQLLTLICVRLC